MKKRLMIPLSGAQNPETSLPYDIDAHIAEWLPTFRHRVEERLSPAVIQAELDDLMRRIKPALASFYSSRGLNIEEHLEKTESLMRGQIVREQRDINSGRLFREMFADMLPPLRHHYIATQSITPEWLMGFSNDEALRDQYQKEAAEARTAQLHLAQLAGAKANRKKRETRKDEAHRIYKAPNPTTGAPWKSKEECIKYLMASHVGAHGWSRAASIGYLPKKGTNSSARKAPKRGA